MTTKDDDKTPTGVWIGLILFGLLFAAPILVAAYSNYGNILIQTLTPPKH